MSQSLVVQKPAGFANHLVLLFHGVGANAEDLAPLGREIARRSPQSLVVSVSAPNPSDFGRGWQWFSVRDVDEANRPARVAAATPVFESTVQHWQVEAALGSSDTTLVGFSQGAIMALESTQQSSTVAGRVVAIAGRFAQPVRRVPMGARFHLLHGEADAVMPVRGSVAAAERLGELGATVTLDTFPGLGHGIDARVVARLLERIVPSSGADLQ